MTVSNAKVTQKHMGSYFQSGKMFCKLYSGTDVMILKYFRRKIGEKIGDF
jgi:hypothetical protein